LGIGYLFIVAVKQWALAQYAVVLKLQRCIMLAALSILKVEIGIVYYQ
jgi:hypothetical protein